jgi:DNA-binding CsgD family transcriptional regulator
MYEQGAAPKEIAEKLNLPVNKVRAKIANMKIAGELILPG